MAALMLNIWLVLSCLLAAFYIYIICRYILGWKAMSLWQIPLDFQPATKVSVLIPARNEAENIFACLSSISSQTYPKQLFEVIILDDHSTDETLTLAADFAKAHPNFRPVRLADYVQAGETQSFKKKAIEIGVRLAQGDLIVTTDADCEVQPDWLALMVSFFEKNDLQFIAAPVNFHREKNLFERFQSLDFFGMMCSTGAGIHLRMKNMCNGANLAYPKAAFLAVNGFAGIDHLATGDDILLMQKIAAQPGSKIGFLKNPAAAVFTKAKPTVAEFLSQRIRWASKSTSYKEWQVTFILGMVFLFCCNMVFSLAAIFWWGWLAAWVFAGSFLVKTILDFFFLGNMARFFSRMDLMRSYFPSQFLHIAYIVVVGILGNLVKRYEWKGRRVR